MQIASRWRVGRKLRTQLLVGFVAVVSIPLFVFAIVAGTRLASRANDAAELNLAIEARTVAERVDEYLVAHERGMSLAAAAATGTMRGGADHRTQLKDLSAAFHDFLTLLVADSSGQIVAAHVPSDPPATVDATKRSVADRPYFRAAMSTNRPYLSDVFRGRGLGNDAIVAISAPIRDHNGVAKGIIEGSLDLRRFETFARGARARLAGRLTVIDGAGHVVYTSQASGLKILQDVDGTSLGLALSQSPQARAITFTDASDGVKVVAAVATATKLGWRVVVAQPEQLAGAVGRSYLFTILLGLGLAAVVAVALALRLSADVTGPIDELIGALRSFDARDPKTAVVKSLRQAPEEVDALIEEFSGMSARVSAAADAQRASESRFRAIFDHAAIGIAVHDNEGRFLDSNAAFQRILGYSAEELYQRRASELSPKEEADVTREPVKALKAGKVDKVSVEKNFIHHDGHTITCELTVSRLDVEVEPGKTGGLVGMLQDVTERRRMERDMAWRASHDILTGLANRAQLQERLNAAMERMHVPGSIAVLVLDLDEFKRVNDSYGHSAGDQLLCEVARRLLSATRGCDVVARFGGDEFALVLDGVDSPVFAEVAARRILAAMTRPIVVDCAEVVLSTSIGIAYAGEGDTVDSLIRNADTAMYRAKHSGKGRFDVFTTAMHREVLEMISLESDLRQALESNEFRPVFQMIVDLQTGLPVGAECLLRWNRRDHGPVSPVKFIPIAEQTGLIVPIGRWILNEACRYGAMWQSRVPQLEGQSPPFSITVNVSGRQLQHPSLLEDVREALSISGLDPRALVLELTESVVMSDAKLTVDRLNALRDLGIRLAIDDFGTGYSSLSYLQMLPVDILKLDKSFIDRLTVAPRDAALVRTIISLADSLSLRCVAEGIESPEQRRAFSEMGCKFGQGYLFTRPLDPEEAGKILSAPSKYQHAA